jgi:phenylacetate-CoA ligase
MHVIETEYVAECVDPASGAPVAPGPAGAHGELVLTNLGRLGSPVLRYRTGDLVALRASTPCACGRSFAALEGGILGRVDDMLVVRGVNVYPAALEDAIRKFPVAEYRVEVSTVRAMSEIKIGIEADPGEDGPAVARQLAASLTRALGLRVPVEALPPGTLPRFEMKASRWRMQRES